MTKYYRDMDTVRENIKITQLQASLIKSARALIKYFKENEVRTIPNPEILKELLCNLEETLDNHIMKKIDESMKE